MSRRLLGIAMMLVALGSSVHGAPPAAAADLKAVGWWARTATTNPASESPTPLPATPAVPVTIPSGAGVGPGQLLVEGVQAGATAVAALRWTLSTSEISPSLVLPVASGSAVAFDAVILACKAATEWTPPAPRPGTWEAKPITDGNSCINGVVAADGSSVGFGLQPLLRKTTLDIVLVAGIDLRLPEGANGSTFRFVFDDPGAQNLTLQKKPASSSDSTTSQPFDDDDSDGFGVDDDTSTFAFGAPTLTPSLGDLRAGDSSGAAAPALEPQDIGPSVPRLETVAATAPDDPAAQTLAVVFLLAGAAIAAWSSRVQPTLVGAAHTVGVGPFRRAAPDTPTASEPEVRGLAGFARPRTQPPTPL